MQRPTAQKIMETVVQAMYGAREPLDEGLVLVPPVYHVLLHIDAYQSLQALIPRIREQAVRRLDEELARLNKRSRAGRLRLFFRRLFFRIRRLLYADRYVQRFPEAAVSYERLGDRWQVDIGVTAAPDAEVGYLVVETDFEAPAQAGYRGSPTVNIRRRTMVLPDGRFETVVSMKTPGGGRTERRMARSTHAIDTRARLSFEDNKGRHIYYMTKPEISIGRLDAGDGGIDVVLDTLTDVSRHHASIRYDEATGAFAIKDLSRFGVTIDGQAIPVAAGDAPEDGWVPLPGKAEVGLADVIFIHFEAL